MNPLLGVAVPVDLESGFAEGDRDQLADGALAGGLRVEITERKPQAAAGHGALKILAVIEASLDLIAIAPDAQLCSSASQLLWEGQTSHDRASSATAPRLPDADQSRMRKQNLLANREISRFPHKERPRMPRSATAPGRSGTRVSVPVHVAFHRVKSVGTRNEVLLRLNILAYAIPCERFKLALAGSPRITRGRGGLLGLSLWGTRTPYSLPVSRRTDTRPPSELPIAPTLIDRRICAAGRRQLAQQRLVGVSAQRTGANGFIMAPLCVTI
jgi:hypothetical protein